MTQITLPIASRTSSDDNDFQDVYTNDVAIRDVVNGNLDNGNVASGAAVAYSKLASMSTGAVLLGNAGTPTATTLTNLTLGATGAVTGVTKEALDATTVADKLGLSQTATVRRGKSIIATEESRTDTAYGTLTTPDQVSSVVLPTDGLIVVAYQAQFKSSVAAAGSAAIFVGANQVKRRGNSALLSDEVFASGTAYRYLSSCPTGLSTESSILTASDVTTGQVVEAAQGQNQGGPCHIFAAAGTYTISVQFKATSGSITAKERKLWVWTMGF